MKKLIFGFIGTFVLTHLLVGILPETATAATYRISGERCLGAPGPVTPDCPYYIMKTDQNGVMSGSATYEAFGFTDGDSICRGTFASRDEFGRPNSRFFTFEGTMNNTPPRPKYMCADFRLVIWGSKPLFDLEVNETTNCILYFKGSNNYGLPLFVRRIE